MSSPDRRGGINAAMLRLPLPIYFLILFLVWTLSRLLLHSGALTLIDLVIDGVGGVIFASVLTALLAVRRRRVGGAAQFADFSSAVRTGTIPPGSDTSTWRPMLERDARSLRISQWVSPIGMLIFAGLGVYVIAASTATDERVLGTVCTVLFVVVAVVVLVQSRRRYSHVRELLDRVSRS